LVPAPLKSSAAAVRAASWFLSGETLKLDGGATVKDFTIASGGSMAMY
jgi:hypothetical protein